MGGAVGRQLFQHDPRRHRHPPPVEQGVPHAVIAEIGAGRAAVAVGTVGAAVAARIAGLRLLEILVPVVVLGMALAVVAAWPVAIRGTRSEVSRRVLGTYANRGNGGDQASQQETRMQLTLRVEQIGHRLPTGFADRNLILIVQAVDKAGKMLTPAPPTPVLSARAGRSLQGLAGRLYAKQLCDFDGNGPVPFWRAQPDFIDTRLKPDASEQTVYTFAGKG